MASSHRGGVRAVFALFLCAIVAAAVFYAIYLVTHDERFEPQAAAPEQRPAAGWAVPAEGEDADGAGLVHLTLTWRDWEPQEGAYDAEGLIQTYQLERWRQEGKPIVVRFVCDLPGGERHKDIPDWLYKRTEGDGVWYDNDAGQGYSPDYGNPELVNAHAQAIAALGECLAPYPVAYVEVGSLGYRGAWRQGEQAEPWMPNEAMREKYLAAYRDAFGQAQLLLAEPYQSAREHHLGLYNDAMGDAARSARWAERVARGGTDEQSGEAHALAPMAEAWRSAPMAASLYGAPPEDLADQLAQDHLTYVRLDHAAWEAVRADAQLLAAQTQLGGRLRVSQADLKLPNPAQAQLGVALTWINEGRAPCYAAYGLQLSLVDEQGRTAATQPVDLALTAVADASEVRTETTFDVSALPEGTYTLRLTLTDPKTGQALPVLAMADWAQGGYTLGSWTYRGLWR